MSVFPEGSVVPACPVCGVVPWGCDYEIDPGEEIDLFPEVPGLVVAKRVDIITGIILNPCRHWIARISWFVDPHDPEERIVWSFRGGPSADEG